MNKLYIAQGDKITGPFSLEIVRGELEAGYLKPTDLAWFEGATDWMPLEQVPGLILPDAGMSTIIPYTSANLLWRMLWRFVSPPPAPADDWIDTWQNLRAWGAVIGLACMFVVAMERSAKPSNLAIAFIVIVLFLYCLSVLWGGQQRSNR